jgi:hypothetical protein
MVRKLDSPKIPSNWNIRQDSDDGPNSAKYLRSANWKPWKVSIIMAAGPAASSDRMPWTKKAWIPVCPNAQRTNGMVMNG